MAAVDSRISYFLPPGLALENAGSLSSEAVTGTIVKGKRMVTLIVCVVEYNCGLEPSRECSRVPQEVVIWI